MANLIGPTWQWGDMWSVWGQPNTAFIVTTNSCVNRFGELTMGRGIAKQLRDRKRSVAYMFGRFLRERCGLDGTCGCVVWTDHALAEAIGSYSVPGPDCWLGMFQVKKHYRDNADLKLIEKSVQMLKVLASNRMDGRVFHLNYPGIGYGRLTEVVVEPLLRPLPPNVHIWRFMAQRPIQIPTEIEPDDSDSES